MRHKPLPATHQPRPKQPHRQPAADDFWRTKTVEELAAEQGVQPVTRLGKVLGRGKELWRDDAELDSFLAAIRERRRNGG